MKTKRRIVIDNDGGTDDFVAIMYVILSKKFDIEGLTLVAGNTDVENVRNNTFKALEMAGISPEEAKKIGIYLPRNVNKNLESDGAQGNNGLGDVSYSLQEGYEVNDEPAEDFLNNLVKANSNKITILTTGPLTNIARLIDEDSSFVDNVEELIIMGGDEGGGNITPYAEFNIYSDPEAAKKVFSAGFKKISMIGFNITKNVTLSPEIEKFLKENGELGNFIYNITRVTADLDRNKNKVDGASMNDVLTAIYLLYGDKMFKTKKAKVTVDTEGETRGRTNISNNGNCDVVIEVDEEKILRELFSTLFPEKNVELEKSLEDRRKRIELRNFLLERYPDEKNVILKKFNGEDAWDNLRK